MGRRIAFITVILGKPTPHLQDSVFHFRQAPSREDIDLVPRGSSVSQSLAARVTNPLNCRSVWDKLTQRDHDDGPGGGPGGGNYELAQSSQSSRV